MAMMVLCQSDLKLHVLALTNTEITDAALGYLIRTSDFGLALQLLDVRGTKVTEEGVRKLKSMLPELKVLCDFDHLSSEWSEFNSEWLIDRDFVTQHDVLPPPTAASDPVANFAGEENVNERRQCVELMFLPNGTVRLRRIPNGPQAQPDEHPEQMNNHEQV